MDPQGSQDSGHGASRRSKKQPMQFMFIDSTTGHGVNAKPDKAVRSFVMKSARSQTNWSTRQRGVQSPKPDSGTDTSASTRHVPRRQIHYRAESPYTAGPRPWQELNTRPNVWSAQADGSPVSSSRSGSIVATRTGSQGSITTQYSHINVCDKPYCTGESCSQLHQALVQHDGCSWSFTHSLDCLPVQMDAKMRHNIDHFVNFISPRLVPMDLHQSSKTTTTKWVANSLQSRTSPPFIYAAITATALVQRPEDALYYKACAISEVNKLLSDPESRIDDNNLTAVFMLLNLEESMLSQRVSGHGTEDDSEWSEWQRKVHLNGLQTMINQRGGLAALSSNKCLQIFLLMHSVAHSIATFERPYATLLDATGQVQRYDLPSYRSRPSSTRILRLYRDLRLDPDLFSIIADIAVFVGDIACLYNDRPPPVDILELQKHVYLLLYRLFDWYQNGSGEERNGGRNPLDQSICLALMILLVRASQPYEPNYRAMLFNAIRRLQASLQKCSIFRWSKSQDLLLWALTLGALAAQGTPDLSFFTQHCRIVFADQGFDKQTNAEELLDRLRKCIWLSKLLDDDVKKLWAQMELCEGEEVIEPPTQEDLPSPPTPDAPDDYSVGRLTNRRFFSKTNT